MKCAALVTAGGVGKRMGGAVLKQFIDLEGTPILARSLMVFQRHELIGAIVVTVPPGQEEACRSDLIARYGLDKVISIVAGGNTRQESVFNGLTTLRDIELVAIHDGVRPFVSPEVITATIKEAERKGASVACARVKETVKRKMGDRLETVPRSDLWLAHTPQTFRLDLILRAHQRAQTDRFDGTDDASLVERLGLPVAIVDDREDNIKITTPEDLERAKMMIRVSAGA